MVRSHEEALSEDAVELVIPQILEPAEQRLRAVSFGWRRKARPGGQGISSQVQVMEYG